MILPSKHLPQDRALLSLGARILQRLPETTTVSGLWEDLTRGGPGDTHTTRIQYDSFVLALDLLYLLGTIELNDGLLVRIKS